MMKQPVAEQCSCQEKLEKQNKIHRNTYLRKLEKKKPQEKWNQPLPQIFTSFIGQFVVQNNDLMGQAKSLGRVTLAISGENRATLDSLMLANAYVRREGCRSEPNATIFFLQDI